MRMAGRRVGRQKGLEIDIDHLVTFVIGVHHGFGKKDDLANIVDARHRG